MTSVYRKISPSRHLGRWRVELSGSCSGGACLPSVRALSERAVRKDVEAVFLLDLFSHFTINFHEWCIPKPQGMVLCQAPFIEHIRVFSYESFDGAGKVNFKASQKGPI